MQQKIKLWPPVQHLSLSDSKNCFKVPASVKILYFAPSLPSQNTLKMAKQYGVELKFTQTKDRFNMKVSTLSQLKDDVPHELGAQGYKIVVNASGISATANSHQGLNYALLRLFELFKYSVLPELTISDWPNTDYRGIMIDLARVVESPEFVSSLLPFLAECRLNQLYLYLENKLVFDSHPKLAHSMAWTKKEMGDLIKAAKGYNIEIIPMIATIGHMESILTVPEYRHLQAVNTNDHLDTALPEARQFMYDIIEEVCELFDSKYVHLAGDECPYLGSGDHETMVKYADFMNLMAEYLAKHGRQGIIWADMVEKYPELLQLLSKNLILTVWKYHPVDNQRITQPEEFMQAGFSTAVAPGILADEPFLPTVERLTRNLPFLPRKTNLWGVINCMWEPRTQTLAVARLGIAAAGACSWNPFMINPDELIRQASEFTYGEDISRLYELIEGGKIFDMMVQSKFAFYHSFELSCNNPLLHLAEHESSDWQELSATINEGYKQLKNLEFFSHKNKEDRKAFEACATLAKTLADCIVIMRSAGAIINKGANANELSAMSKQIRSLACFMQKTLDAQSAAWKISRKIQDPNFTWWFKDPLQYKIKCLNSFADTLSTSAEYNYFLLKFSKGSATSWNLLRVKIFYSDCGEKWQQVFFKTIPLWMDDCLTLKLMPDAGKLPNYFKIVPIYATYHSSTDNWDDMINVSCGKINMSRGKLYEEKHFPATQIYDLDSTRTAITLSKR